MAAVDVRESVQPSATPGGNGQDGQPQEEHARVITIVKEHTYRYLEPRPGSNYRQLFCKGSRIRAEVLYRRAMGVEPHPPEEVARNFNVPLEAVHEAIHYCENNEDFLRMERDRELVSIRERGLDKPPYVPADYIPPQ